MSYKRMKVYERAYESGLKIHKLSKDFPKHEQYELSSQLRRATKSIALNIAEGYGKSSSAAEFKRYLLIALGSCNETLVILDYCRDLGYMHEQEYSEFQQEYEEIGKMLYTLHKNWKDMRESAK